VIGSVPPSFLILDGCAPNGRNKVFGIATTTRAAWWSNEFGRLYTWRDVWGAENMSGDAPVSIAYRYVTGEPRGTWFLLGARGMITENHSRVTARQLRVRGPLRRIRTVGNQCVAVGAHGQVLRGEGSDLKPLNGLEAEASAGRFLVDVVGSGDDDLTVVGRRGEVFHWDGGTWHAWHASAGDLHVAHLHDHRLFVGGDGGWLAERVDGAWRPIRVPTSDPIVGVCWYDHELWAATPTAVFAGGATELAAVDGPGFGGQLAAGDGILYCFGVAHVAQRLDGRWSTLAHPEQHYQGPPLAWPVLGDSLSTAVLPVRHPAADLGGTLFSAGKIRKADLARWKKLGGRAPIEMLSAPGMYSVLEIEGDLHVRGNLSTFDRELVGLVVHGDLIVDGVFSDNDHPQTLTIVGGSLRARTIYTSGQLEVKGDVTCEHLLGDYNDFSMRVHGTARARVFYPENHAFDFDAPPRFELCIDDDSVYRVNPQVKAVIKPATGKQLRAAFIREVLNGDLDDEIEVRRKEFLGVVCAGGSIWRRKPSKRAKATKNKPKQGTLEKPAKRKSPAARPASTRNAPPRKRARRPAAKRK
jgi:hypothetical protein